MFLHIDINSFFASAERNSRSDTQGYSYGSREQKHPGDIQQKTYQHKNLSLLDYEDDERDKRLGKKIHKLREKFGLDILKSGGEL